MTINLHIDILNAFWLALAVSLGWHIGNGLAQIPRSFAAGWRMALARYNAQQAAKVADEGAKV